MRLVTTCEDEYSYPLHMSGTATTLPAEDENAAVLALRECVKEVTGKDVVAPARNPIGFVWG